MEKYIKEACVETIDQCVRAEKNGADRIELCDDLANDGLTPPIHLIQQAKERLKIPIRVMIRPRPGDFVYSDEDIDEMKRSIGICKDIGVEGVVFGACTAENTLDLKTISYLVTTAKPLKVTIHKAIDSCDDPVQELINLQNLSVDSVLSSGKAAKALEGVSLLSEMVQNAGDIELIACGKVKDSNLAEVDSLVHAPAYHGKKIVGDLK
ncbi:MAG: copper homeostasis protein CutC [Bacteroidota bacterium]